MDQVTRISFLSKAKTPSAKFNLFLKNHEIKQVESVLRQISLMSEEDRRDWIEENGDLMNRAFSVFIEDSNSTLEEMQFDSESLELSKQLVTSLRDTTNIVQGILSADDHKLTS